ncbi:hypothetical protein ACET3Z_014648 [Daucus carota]
MADAAVSFAIEKLNVFLTQRVNTRIGVEDGVRWLKDELGYLQSSVRGAEARQEMDPPIWQWMNNVKDVANDALIILERFSALEEEHAVRKEGLMDCLWSSVSSVCLCRKEASLYDIGKEIELLKGRVVVIKSRRDEYGITNILATQMVERRKRTLLRATSFENQVDVVGFEDDFKTLLDELVSEDLSLKLISIHGMGGLGKTTLASKLYHSSKVSHFKSRAWVCVSQEYNIKDVLKTMIKSFGRHVLGHELDFMKMDEIDLLQHLRKLLVDCDGYLVVIDDIWDIEAWIKIKKAFPDKQNGSRVIITTRNKIIAQKVDDRCFVHPLRFLREDESWQLFLKRAKPTPNLEKLGKQMVCKCGGLPLAIMILSGLLLHKKSYEDWSLVKDHLWRKLKADSVEIQEILSLSYYDLSFQLRRCFLYLARFPEDHTFEVNNLKLLWIAEEFISEADEGDGLVMEDVSEDYLNELINRNMIQIATFRWDGHVWDCRIHDLVRDLAIQKASEEKLLLIFDSSKDHSSPIHLLNEQPRHAIYNGIGKYLKLHASSSNYLKLRSLAITNEPGSFFKLEELKCIYTRFKYLKTLDLSCVKSDRMPKEIGDLVLLKFLGLISGRLPGKYIAIPRTIGKLKRLQTLCGSDTSRYAFPKEIRELKELRHLNCGQIYGGRLCIGSHQIQTLSTIAYDDWIQIDSVNLTNLRRLFIAGDAHTLDFIANLTSLRTFFLKSVFTPVLPTMKPLSSCIRLKSVFLWGTIKDPSELGLLPDSLTHLTLHTSEFTKDPMPTLAESSVAQQCNPTALTPCLPAFTGPDQPSQLCCTRLDQQKPCFCQYEKNPALQKYFNSPNAKKVSDACKIPIPKC